jgi:hypothetical protein
MAFRERFRIQSSLARYQRHKAAARLMQPHRRQDHHRTLHYPELRQRLQIMIALLVSSRHPHQSQARLLHPDQRQMIRKNKSLLPQTLLPQSLQRDRPLLYPFVPLYLIMYLLQFVQLCQRKRRLNNPNLLLQPPP